MPYKLYINGEWIDAENGETIDIKNPATGSKYAEVMLQPVILSQIAQLLDLPHKEKASLQKYVNQIVFDGLKLSEARTAS